MTRNCSDLDSQLIWRVTPFVGEPAWPGVHSSQVLEARISFVDVTITS
jgi:hypothetical protein